MLCREGLEVQSYPIPGKASLSAKRHRQEWRTRVSPPLCGEEMEVQSCPTPPTNGGPYPRSGRGRTGGTQMHPPLCGEQLECQSYTAPPRGVPIPQTARAGPE